jgi:4-diphosphocytidyl-2-C-methyl-D-erythritol kinase
MRLTLRASAKVNLDLRVLGCRPDGYHEVRTVLQTLDLHDTVTIEAARGDFALDGDPAAMPLDRTNLVWRAAQALWRAAGRRGAPRDARVRVVKRIPARAGLGGGSSDAAAALVGLSRLWRMSPSLSDLVPVAVTLGADVPFFLLGGTALGVGRGEQLYPLIDLPRRHVVLVLPDFGVATADAYRWLAEDREAVSGPGAPRARARPGTLDCGPLAPDPGPWALDLAAGVNDLETAVERRHPAIRAARRRLAAAGAELARMSGSGSAVFGLFPSARQARRAAAGLASAGHRVVVTRTRARNPAERGRLA